MIIKQCQFAGRDERGIYIHVLHNKFNTDSHIVKTANLAIPQLNHIAAFLKKYNKRNNCTYVLVNAMGAGEYWSSNNNGDFFGENSLLHVPTNWNNLSYEQQIKIGRSWEWGYPTFYNAHAFTHHKNSDPTRAFGNVIYCFWDNRMKRVLLVIEIDHQRAAQFGATSILDKINNGEYVDVSMGTKVPYDLCLHPNTLITTKNGIIPINSIKIGDYVLTHQGNYKKVLKTFENKSDDLLNIHAVGTPDPITCTSNHPIFILRKSDIRSCYGSANGEKRRHNPDNNCICTFCKKELEFNPKWAPAEQVIVGDYVLFPIINGDEKFDPTLARLLGYYIGNGCIVRSRRGKNKKGAYYLAGLSFSDNKDSTEHINSLFNTLSILSNKNEPRIYSEGKDRNAISTRLHDKELAKTVLNLCGELCRTKHLPIGYERWTNEAKLNLLGALIDTDGSQDHGAQAGSIRFSTVNERLAWEVRNLCFSLRISASLQRNISRGGFNVQETTYYSIGIPTSYSEELSKYSCKVKPYNVRNGSKIFFWKNYACIPIDKIETSDYDGFVYNLSVEDEETYTANGVIVHNCSICTDFDRLIGKNPKQILIEHKKNLIRGLSTTKEDYCTHLKNELNRVYPDGKKVMMLNLHPRFFDISFVFIGADRTAKVMAKLASKQCPIRENSPMCKKGCFECAIPSYHIHDVWSQEMPIQKTAGFKMPKISPRTMSVLINESPDVIEAAVKTIIRQKSNKRDRNKTAELDDYISDAEESKAKAFFNQKRSMNKNSEIEKDIRSNFSSNITSLENNEPDIPKDIQNLMMENLPDSLSTAGSLGIVVKPKEFQRMILISSGQPNLANELESQNIVFPPDTNSNTGSLFSMGDSILPNILTKLIPMLMGRSAFSPCLNKRIIQITISTQPKQQSPISELFNNDELLNKLSYDYRQYRKELLYKTASLVNSMLMKYPTILENIEYINNPFDKGLAKTASSMVKSIIGMLPVDYLNKAYTVNPISPYIDNNCSLEGLIKAGALYMAAEI